MSHGSLVKKVCDFLCSWLQDLVYSYTSFVLPPHCGLGVATGCPERFFVGPFGVSEFSFPRSMFAETKCYYITTLQKSFWRKLGFRRLHQEPWYFYLGREFNYGWVIRVRHCHSKHQRHRVAHEVIAGPGHKRMSFVLWLRLIVRLSIKRKEKIPVNSPLLVHEAIGQLVPMTGSFMSQMDKAYAPIMGWY